MRIGIFVLLFMFSSFSLAQESVVEVPDFSMLRENLQRHDQVWFEQKCITRDGRSINSENSEFQSCLDGALARPNAKSSIFNGGQSIFLETLSSK